MRQMTAREFRAWELYDQVEPIGSIRSDYQSAQIVQALVNANRTKKDKVVKLEQCLLKFGPAEEEKQKKSPDQIFSILRLLAAAHANEPDAKSKTIIVDPATGLEALPGTSDYDRLASMGAPDPAALDPTRPPTPSEPAEEDLAGLSPLERLRRIVGDNPNITFKE